MPKKEESKVSDKPTKKLKKLKKLREPEPYLITKLLEEVVQVTFNEDLDPIKSAAISKAIHQIKTETKVLGSVNAGCIRGFVCHQDCLKNILRLYT